MKPDLSQPSFSDVDIYYNYVFDLGSPVNPVDAARKLLETELAQGFQNYFTGKPEVADKYGEMVNFYDKLTNIHTILEELEAHPSWKGYLKLLKHDPIMIGKTYLKDTIDAFAGPNYEDDRQSKEDDSADNGNLEDSNNLDGVSELESNEGENKEEFKDFVAQAMADLLGLLAIHEHVDREIFDSDYLEGAIARVGLQPFATKLDGFESIDFDVGLTIHRSGVAILTIYGVFSDSMSLAKMVKLKRMTPMSIEEVDLPIVIIQRYFSLLTGITISESEIKELEDEIPSDHSRYIKFETEEDSEFGAILDSYRYFIIEAIQGTKYRSIDKLHASLRSPVWHGYPIMFIKKINPGYPTGTVFKEQNAEILAKLVMGLHTSSPLKSDMINEICSDDLSIVDSYSLYLTEGSGTVLYYDNHELGVPPEFAANEWIRLKFLTTVVIDMLLLQRGILTAFNFYLDKTTYDISELTALKLEYLLALEEFESLGISNYGSVNDIIKRGQDIFRINDQRKLFVLKLENIESLVQVTESRQKADRDKIIKILTTLITLVFSLIPVQGVIDVLKEWPTNNLITTTVKAYPAFSVLFIYFAVVFITLFVLWYGSIKTRGWRKQILENRSTPTSLERTISPIKVMITAQDSDKQQ